MRPGAGSGETSHERNGTRHTEHPLRGGSRPAWTTLRGSKWSASSASKGSLQQREARAPGASSTMERTSPPRPRHCVRDSVATGGTACGRRRGLCHPHAAQAPRARSHSLPHSPGPCGTPALRRGRGRRRPAPVPGHSLLAWRPGFRARGCRTPRPVCGASAPPPCFGAQRCLRGT